MHVLLQLGVPCQLEQQPCHSVACGVVPCEQDQQHIPVICGRRKAACLYRSRQRAPHGVAVKVRRESSRGVRPCLNQQVPHGLAEAPRLRLRVTHEGTSDIGVRGVHGSLGDAQQRQLQLRLRLVQQKVAHVDRAIAKGRHRRQALGASPGARQGHRQNLSERRERQERLCKLISLGPPMLVVHRRDHAVEKHPEVRLLAHVHAGDALSVPCIGHQHAADDSEDVAADSGGHSRSLGAGRGERAVHNERGHGDVAA
mmetsp:Transcript_66841/g.169539  ORF Transcript_66841/g.169539 Transcript_66841/m.169539 type:complete len:256 (+) Transcript_66841:718-1485(+)